MVQSQLLNNMILCIIISKGYVQMESKIKGGGAIVLVPCDSFRRYEVVKRGWDYYRLWKLKISVAVLYTIASGWGSSQYLCHFRSFPDSTVTPSFIRAALAR